MNDQGNQGIVVSGGSLNAGAVAAGAHATATSIQTAGDALGPQARDDLLPHVTALRTALMRHRDELVDADPTIELADEALAQLTSPAPTKGAVRQVLTRLVAAAGPTTAVAGMVTAIREALAGLF